MKTCSMAAGGSGLRHGWTNVGRHYNFSDIKGHCYVQISANKSRVNLTLVSE